MDFPNDSEGCKQVNRSLGRLAALFPGDCNIFPRCLLAAIEKQPRAGQPADRLWDANPNAGDARTCKVPSFADFQAADSSGKVDVTAMDFTGGHALTVAFRVRPVTFDTSFRNWLYIGPDQNQNAAGSKLELRPYLDGGEKRIRIVVGGSAMLSDPLPATDWLNVQVVVPPGAHMTDIKLYVNGNVLATTPESGDDPLMNIAGQTMYINGNPLDADVSAAYAHFKLWDYALTPQQLQDVSDYKRDWWPVIDYPMEERDGLLLYNRAQNADHMTLTANVVRQDDDAHELPFSYTEFFGWSPGPSGERIPSAAWDPSKDAIGGALQHRGPCPRDAQLNPDGTINFRGDGATKNTTWWRALSWTVPNAFDPASDTLPPQIQETDEYYLIVDCDAPQYLLTHGKPAPEATAVILAPSNVEVDTPVSLSATGSTGTPDDPIVSYHWEFGDGQGGSGASVQHTYTSEGQKTVTLTVVTQQGRTATSQALIDVSAPVPNLPPVAVINGPDSVPQGNSANFQGTGSSDPDGTIAGYEWTLPDGTKSTNPMATYVFNDLGDQTLTLKVTDDNGATGTTTKTVSVTPPDNQLPTVTITGAPASDIGATQQYFAQANDPDGSIASIEWTFPDGSTQTGPLVSYEFKAPAGDQTISVTVTDNDGGTTTVTHTVTVSDPDAPPHAVISGPDEVVIGEEGTFDSSGSNDPDGSIASVLWTFSDGSTATTTQATHRFMAPVGQQSVTLKVTDNEGETDTAIKLVTVLARPTIDITWPGGGQVTAGESLTLDASGSTSPNGDVTCTWDFGDGSPEATGCVQTHTYASEGTYTATLTVTDDKGASNTATQEFGVTAASFDMPDSGVLVSSEMPSGGDYAWVDERLDHLSIPRKRVRFWGEGAFGMTKPPTNPQGWYYPFDWTEFETLLAALDVDPDQLDSYDFEFWPYVDAYHAQNLAAMQQMIQLWETHHGKTTFYGMAPINNAGTFDGQGFNTQLDWVNYWGRGGQASLDDGQKGLYRVHANIKATKYYSPFVIANTLYSTPTLYHRGDGATITEQEFDKHLRLAMKVLDDLAWMYPDAPVLPWIALQRYTQSAGTQVMTAAEATAYGKFWRAQKHRLAGIMIFSTIPKPSDLTIVDAFMTEWMS